MNTSDLAELDARLNDVHDGRWDAFYANRARPCPFFAGAPDESLSQWLDEGLIPAGRALDLGCGNARNAILLARHGFQVQGVDYSQRALDWAAERVAEAGVAVALSRANVFDIAFEPASFDLVYDSGCFHHIAPHRRQQYVDLVVGALKPGGWLGLTCFRPEGGSCLSDEEVYEQNTLGGGLGYTVERLAEIWSHGLEVQVVRQMRKQAAGGACFGEDFLSVLLARKL